MLIKSFKKILSALTGSEILEHKLHAAAARLMIEVMYSDNDISSQEESVLLRIFRKDLELNYKEAKSIIGAAKQAKNAGGGINETVETINTHYDDKHKITILESLWKIAHADGVVERLEVEKIKKLSTQLHIALDDQYLMKELSYM